MRRFACRFLVAANLIALAPDALAESRPRYGGTFTVELHDSPTLTDPTDWPARLVPLVYDRLVRLDEHGEPQAALAISWQHDASGKRWEFQLRPHTTFHDGSPLTAAAVVASLKDWTNVSAANDSVVGFQTDVPDPDFPVRLAGARGAILMRGSDGLTIGTGPFRITEWQPGKRVLLTAYERYWSGRPFLDFVEVRMGRSYRDQGIDLELGKADLVEIPIGDPRRASQPLGRTWSSAPSDLLALLFEHGHDAAEEASLREGVALSIDRAAMQNVLLQRQGDPTGAILPAWLSGYAFLFAAVRDLDRARQFVAALPKPGPRISLAYDPADPLARPVAERIAFNAREAGITIQTLPGSRADARLIRFRLRSLEPAQVLAEVRTLAGAGGQPILGGPERSFAAERALLEDFRIVPLFHLPETYGLSSRVRNWDPRPWGDWRLENVWLEARTP
jgi:MarR-like DNA-binding transcriptional regulator SgrR of sgrS sRNA